MATPTNTSPSARYMGVSAVSPPNFTILEAAVTNISTMPTSQGEIGDEVLIRSTGEVYKLNFSTAAGRVWELMMNPGGNVADFTTDSGNVAPLLGVVALTGGNGIQTSGATNVATFALTGTYRLTDAGATVGPTWSLDRLSASPAVSDIIGRLAYTGRSSTAVTRTYAAITANIVSPTNTAEAGSLDFQVMVAGTLSTNATLSNTAYTVNVPTTVTGSGHAPLTLVDTSAGSATAGPNLILYRSGASASGNVIGAISWQTTDSASSVSTPLFIKGIYTTNTAGAESTELQFVNVQAGASKIAIDLFPTGGQYRGNNTNVVAPAGYIGEILSTNTAAPGTTLASTVANNVNNVALTAGNWMVFGVVNFVPAATTTVTIMDCGINATISTFTALGVDYAEQGSTGTIITGASTWTAHTPIVFLSLSATTTYYLNAKATFATSTLTAYGKIQAVRIG